MPTAAKAGPQAATVAKAALAATAMPARTPPTAVPPPRQMAPESVVPVVPVVLVAPVAPAVPAVPPRLVTAPGTVVLAAPVALLVRSEEHTSEIQSLQRTSYAVFCMKKKKKT